MGIHEGIPGKPAGQALPTVHNAQDKRQYFLSSDLPTSLPDVFRSLGEVADFGKSTGHNGSQGVKIDGNTP
jgi:hypothetical protein